MNNIELSTVYLPLLDEVYKEASKTSILEGDEVTVKKGSNGEIKIAKLDMDGLGDFSRNDGYTKGSTSFVWETVKYDKERSQDLRIDRLDNDEALETPFAKLSGDLSVLRLCPKQTPPELQRFAVQKESQQRLKSFRMVRRLSVLCVLAQTQWTN